VEEEVRFPAIEDDVVEGIVTYWHFEEGEELEESDDLVEISCSENTYSISSPISGVLIERCVVEGEKVKIGDTLAVINTED